MKKQKYWVMGPRAEILKETLAAQTSLKIGESKTDNKSYVDAKYCVETVLNGELMVLAELSAILKMYNLTEKLMLSDTGLEILNSIKKRTGLFPIVELEPPC